MRIKLTKRSVEAAPVPDLPGKDLWLTDTETRGFCCRVTHSGSRIYTLQTRIAGRVRKIRLGRHGDISTAQARELARTFLGRIALGEDPSRQRNERRRAPTVSELTERFLAEHSRPKKKPSSVRNDMTNIARHIRPALGTLRVTDVTRGDIEALHHAMRDTPYMANRVLATLSKMFNLAEVWGLRPDGTNPCRHVQRFKERARQRYLSEAEINRLGQALDELEAEGRESHAAAIAVRLLLLTGARLGEILNLRFRDVDPERRVLRIPDSKTGQKTIPISEIAVEILRDEARTATCEWVVPGRSTAAPLVDLERPWRRIRSRAQLDDVRLHDLRHTFASVALAENVSLGLIGGILGHSSTATTKRYAHLLVEAATVAADRTAGRLSAALEGS